MNCVLCIFIGVLVILSISIVINIENMENREYLFGHLKSWETLQNVFSMQDENSENIHYNIGINCNQGGYSAIYGETCLYNQKKK